MFPGHGEQLFNPLLVEPQPGVDFGCLISHAMEKPIQLRPIKESKINHLALEAGAQGGQVFRFALSRTADVVGNLSALQKIKNVRTAIHAIRLQGAFLLRKIKQGDVAERDVVEIEVATELQLHLDELA